MSRIMNPPTDMLEIRPAVADDLDALLRLEERCFESDRLSRRSLNRFIKAGSHQLVTAVRSGELVGYALLLHRTATSLARLYSIAVHPAFQGQGIANQLVAACEGVAREWHCAFMRLEVRTDNRHAAQLYRRHGYRQFGTAAGYYEDGCDALRLEKRLQVNAPPALASRPYYRQTTDFTCGPAALMMAMCALDPDYPVSRREELQIWREATTIFMTAGHGGCSPHGLALSAWQRGFHVTLYINQDGVPFIEGVRNPEKKEVMELVHQDFLDRIGETGIDIEPRGLTPDLVRQLLAGGGAMLMLISTWRLNRNKAPHWVFVAGTDDRFVYINDPDFEDEEWLTETDNIAVPIDIESFIQMACFGRSRLRTLLLLKPRLVVTDSH